MSRIKSVDKVNQKSFFKAKKYKNLQRDKFVELGDRGLNCLKYFVWTFMQMK